MVSHFFRRYQQPLLIVFTVLIIISFVGFFNGGFLDKATAGHAATIYGRPVTQIEMQREGRKFELARDLGLQDLWQSLIGKAQSLDEAVTNFTWNSLVLRHETDALGLGVTDEEVLAAIQAMPVFQTNGVFDPVKYAQIFEGALNSRGFGKEHLEELVRDDLRLNKLKALLGATAVPSPVAVRAAYDQHYQKTDASVVRLRLGDFLATATAPDEDVAKLFEARKSQLKSEELRTVRFAAFILPTTDKPLEGKERAAALQKLGKAAEEFSIAMTAKDANFAELAAKAGVKAEETPAFSRQQPPAVFADAPAVVAAAFKLTMKEPNSDVKSSDRGYYVLQLVGITEARPLTFEEAKPQLVEQLKTERAQEALNLKAAEIRNKIEAGLKAGKSFADAAQAAGVKAEAFGVFSQAEPKLEAPDAREIMMASFEMKEGELSPFTPTATGGVLIYVGPRPPVDEAKFATDQVLITDGLSRANREMLFAEWLKLRRAEAKVTTNRRG